MCIRDRNQTARADGYADGAREVIAALLPAIDNLERAVAAAGEESPLLEGVKMTQNLLLESLKKFGLEEIPAQGEALSLIHISTGEYAIGVTIEKSAVLYAGDDSVGYNYPAGNSAVPDGVAIVKDCPNLENAKLFVDFVTGVECQTEQSTNWSRRPVRTDMDTGCLLYTSRCV